MRARAAVEQERIVASRVYRIVKDCGGARSVVGRKRTETAVAKLPSNIHIFPRKNSADPAKSPNHVIGRFSNDGHSTRTRHQTSSGYSKHHVLPGRSHTSHPCTHIATNDAQQFRNLLKFTHLLSIAPPKESTFWILSGLLRTTHIIPPRHVRFLHGTEPMASLCAK